MCYSTTISHVTVKTVVVKGKAPVDPECTAKLKVAHVYYEGNDVYDVMLNQVCHSCHNRVTVSIY